APGRDERHAAARAPRVATRTRPRVRRRRAPGRLLRGQRVGCPGGRARGRSVRAAGARDASGDARARTRVGEAGLPHALGTAEGAPCLCLADAERAEYLAQGAELSRLHHVPPPLDLPDPGQVPRAAVPTVAYLGQLHPIKRIGVLLDAFELVRRELPQAQLEV